MRSGVAMGKLEESKDDDSVDPTFVVVGITALAYGCGYAFECAYLMYFAVPLELVQVEVRSILSFAGSISLVLIAYHLLDPLPRLYWKVEEKYRRTLAAPFAFLVLAVVTAFMIPYPPLWFGPLVPLYKIIATFFRAARQPVSTLSKGFEALDLERELERKVKHRKGATATQYIREKTGRNPVPLVLFAGVAVLIAYAAGKVVAHEKQIFLVELSTPPCAILTTYGSVAICGEFEGSQMLGNIRTIELSEAGPLHLLRLEKKEPYKAKSRSDMRK